MNKENIEAMKARVCELIETGKALGWDVTEETQEEETERGRRVVMEEGGGRISVSWVGSDNTAKQITWQKDGLLIPVDTEITSVHGVVYVPAAFFETAMRAAVENKRDEILVTTPEPAATPANDAEQAGANEAKEPAEKK